MTFKSSEIDESFSSKTVVEFKTRFGEWRWEKRLNRLGQSVFVDSANPSGWLWHPLPVGATKTQVKAIIAKLTTEEYVC